MEQWVRDNHLDEPLVEGGITYDALGRPTGLQAVLTPENAIGGTEAGSVPPATEAPRAGTRGSRRRTSRGYLLGNQLGGSGTDPRNIAIIYQNGANTPGMLPSRTWCAGPSMSATRSSTA